MKKIKKRDSKYEIIRLFAMLFIILCHYSWDGNWHNESSVAHFYHMLFFPLGQIGVYLFILISGYFLATRKINVLKCINRIKPLWIKTIFYSWLFLILNFIFHFSKIDMKSIIVSIFPIILNNYWFMTCFILLILISPILNGMIQNLSQKSLEFYLLLLILFVVIIPIIKPNNAPFGEPWSTSMLATVYLIAGYIKKYNIKLKLIINISLIILGLSGEYVSMFLFRNRPVGGNFLEGMTQYSYGIFPLLVALGIFELINCYAKSFYNPIINFIASNVLAAYLVTDNMLFKNFFWNKFLNVGQMGNNYLNFIVLGILIISLTIILCALFDKVYDKIYSSCCKKFAK